MSRIGPGCDRGKPLPQTPSSHEATGRDGLYNGVAGSRTGRYQRLNASDQQFLHETEPESDPKTMLSGRVFTTSSKTKMPRRPNSVTAIVGLLLNILITTTPVYFAIFALLVYKGTGQPADSSLGRFLLPASVYGPTIFPLVFAAVVGRFLKSLADRSLEQGATVALLEYLLASRTVSGALVAPFRFRVAHLIIVPLVLLWSLSPIGSQAAIRSISTELHSQNYSQIISYIDVNKSTPLTIGAQGKQQYINTVNGAFIAALYGPADAKDAPYDVYGQLKVPMYEAISLTANTSTIDGWLNIASNVHNVSTHASLVGIPSSGVPLTTNASFSIETSYFATNCTVSSTNIDPNKTILAQWAQQNALSSGIAWNGGAFAFAWGINHTSDGQTNRNMSVWSLDTKSNVLSTASCSLTTTYVEVEVACVQGSCGATAVRLSKLPHADESWSVIDQYPLSSANVWTSFVNATTAGHVAYSSPIEQYLYDPSSAIGSLNEVVLANVGNAAFSRRFAQLLNTFWTITLAPDAALGVDFLHDPQTQGSVLDPVHDGSGLTSVDTTIGTLHSQQLVLSCNQSWTALLLFASLIMLMAGLTTTVLDARRKGPDIIDLFVSTLRENSYAHIEHHSSLEDGSDQVRRLQGVRVRLGDVQPLSAVGYVAIATLDKPLDVGLLTHDRQYI